MSIRPDPSDFEDATPVTPPSPYRTVRIFLEGRPTPKGRPRFSRRSGRAYTPQKTVDCERAIAEVARRHFNAPMEGPIRLTVNAFFKPAASWSKKKAAAHLGKPHMGATDADNLAKLASDSLNGIAYPDDRNIFSQTATKFWSETEGTEIIIEAFTPEAFA